MRVRTTLQIWKQRGTAKVDQAPEKVLSAAFDIQPSNFQWHLPVAHCQERSVETHVSRPDPGDSKGSLQAERRKRSIAVPDERNGVSNRAVGIEREEIVTQCRSRCGQRLGRGVDHAPLENFRCVESITLIGPGPVADRFVDRSCIGQENDIARGADRLCQNLVRLRARQRSTPIRESHAVVRSREIHVVDNERRLPAIQVLDQM